MYVRLNGLYIADTVHGEFLFIGHTRSDGATTMEGGSNNCWRRNIGVDQEECLNGV